MTFSCDGDEIQATFSTSTGESRLPLSWVWPGWRWSDWNSAKVCDSPSVLPCHPLSSCPQNGTSPDCNKKTNPRSQTSWDSFHLLHQSQRPSDLQKGPPWHLLFTTPCLLVSPPPRPPSTPSILWNRKSKTGTENLTFSSLQQNQGTSIGNGEFLGDGISISDLKYLI